jgi:hypothetical protein
MVAALVMGAQEILAEVIAGIMPYRVDVVGVVLGIVVLDEEGGAVEPVVVGLA